MEQSRRDELQSQTSSLLDEFLHSSTNFFEQGHKLLLPQAVDPQLTGHNKEAQRVKVRKYKDCAKGLKDQVSKIPDKENFYGTVIGSITSFDTKVRDQAVLLETLRALKFQGLTRNQTFNLLADRTNNLITDLQTMPNSQEALIDYLDGPFAAIFQIGEIIGETLTSQENPPQEEWKTLQGALFPLLRLYKDHPEALTTLTSRIDGLQVAFHLKNPPGLQPIKTTQEMPVITEKMLGASLLDAYLSITEASGSQKVALWQATPEYRAEAEKHGVDLTKFWNITDPDKTQTQYAAFIGEIDDRTKRLFEVHLKRLTGLPIVELTPELVRVMSDQIVEAADKTKNELSNGEHSIPATRITTLFDLENRDGRFAIASRVKKDLYLGDQTNDCTAFHPKPGVNSWSVPVWLSDPGFTFFIIRNNRGQLAGKFGLFLTLVDDKPAVTVDSFEVGFITKEDVETPDLIRQGLQVLGRWAKQVGAESVVLNTMSNSSGALELLKEYEDTSAPLQSHQLLGGLRGTSEYRRGVTGTEVEQEKIFLQTDILENQQVIADHARALERFLNNFLFRSEDYARRVLTEALQKGGWSEVFSVILETNFPQIADTLGTKWEDFAYLTNPEGIDSESWQEEAEKSAIFNKFEYNNDIGNINNLEEILKAISSKENDDLIFAAYRDPTIDFEDESDLARKFDIDRDGKLIKGESLAVRKDYRMGELSELERLIVRLSWMRFENVSPEEAIQFLYGASSEVDTSGLSLELGRLKIAA